MPEQFPLGYLFDVHNADLMAHSVEMRISIDMDDTLMAPVMESGELKTREAIVEEGRRQLAHHDAIACGRTATIARRELPQLFGP